MSAAARLNNDKNEIAAAIGLLINPGDVFELRVPKAGKFRTISGYFDNAEALAKALAAFPAEQLPGVYITLNPLNPALMARANNRAAAYAENTATDKDVQRRRWFPLDFDAVRPAGISSSDEEHEAAHRKAVQVREHLRSLGWPEPIYADSGNGAHLLYRVDLPNDDETRGMLQAALESLSAELSDDQIKIDRAVFNAARIWKLYGTVGRKGENLPERPHRLARILHVPAELEILLPEHIAAVIKPKEQPKAPAPAGDRPRAGDSFDLGAWIARHGIETRGPFAHNGGSKWILDACPFNPEHDRGEAMLGIAPAGGIFFKCQHDSCRNHTWADVREIYEGPRPKPAPVAPTPAPTPATPVNDNKRPESSPEKLGNNLIGKGGADSMIVADALRGMYLFDEVDREWFAFKKIWRKVSEGEINRLLLGILDRELFGNYSPGYASGIATMVRHRLGRSAAVADDHDAVLDSWNRDRTMLPMRNGILNINTGELAKHAPEHLMNWYIPHDFTPGAKCPTVDSFIDRCANGDGTASDVLYCYLAAVLRGMSSLQKYLELVGQPGTGKSTYIKLASALVGADNTITTTMDQLHTNRFETAGLYGKRLVVISDADKYGGSVEIFKAVTGQDPLRREEKNKQIGRPFIYGGMVIVAANQPVQFSDTSTAMARRRVPVYFDKRLDKNSRDTTLFDRMELEIPGLINKLIAIPVQRIQDVLNDVKDVRAADNSRSLVDTNSVAEWINERLVEAETTVACQIGDLSCDANSYLYPNYKRHMESTGRKGIVALRSFRSSMMEIITQHLPNVKQKRTGAGWVITGVQIRTNYDAHKPCPITKEMHEDDSDRPF